MSARHSPLQSFVTFRNSQEEDARGTLLKLERSSVVFEVYNPYSVVQLSEVLTDLTIRRGSRTIYRGRAVVNNLVNTGLMLIVSAMVVDTFDNVNWLLFEEDDELVRGESSRFVEAWRESRHVSIGYRVVVGEIRSFLFELSRWLEPLDANAQKGPGTRAQDELIHDIVEPILDEVGELRGRFEEEAAKTPHERLDIYKAFAQRDLHPLIMRAPFPFRAYSKPLGYAGDFETINMLLRDELEGPTAYAKLVHSLFLASGVAEAHRNRIQILKNALVAALEPALIERKVLRILNIGCGPVHELSDLISLRPELASAAEFHLIDFDKRALEFACDSLTRLAKSKRVSINATYLKASVNELLKNVAGKGVLKDEPAFDLVYCAGLFDYFSDRICRRLMRMFVSMLKPGGWVMVTNVHPMNPYRFNMEHILEWYLVYREEAEMRALGEGLGRVTTFTDPTGINVAMQVVRPLLPDA